MNDRMEFAAVRREHKELLKTLEEVNRLVETGLADLTLPRWAARLRGELHRLLTRLDNHFRREEAGFYRIIAEERPTRARLLEELKGEHRGFLDELRAVMDRALRPPEDTLHGDVQDVLVRWLSRLQEHERRETDLLVESVVRDMGALD